MSGKVYICPECNEQFKNRKLANEHRRELNHKGAIVVDFVKDKPKPDTKMPKKGNYKCPQCAKTSRTLKGIKDHMKAKKHIGEPELQESKKSLPQQTISSTPEKPSPPPVPDEPIMAFMKIKKEIAEMISPILNQGLSDGGERMSLLQNPQNGNYFIQYYNTTSEELDYLQFKYQFTSLELDNSDLIFCLTLLNDISKSFRVFDMAGLKMYGTASFEDGNIIISLDEAKRLTLNYLVEELSQCPPHELACVSGIWKKTYNKPKPVTTPSTNKPLNPSIKPTTPPPKKLPLKTQPTQGPVESFDDWDIVMWGAESFASEIGMGIHRHNKYPHGQRTISSRQNYKPPPPPEPMSYPIFGVTQFVVIIDRIISFESND